MMANLAPLQGPRRAFAPVSPNPVRLPVRRSVSCRAEAQKEKSWQQNLAQKCVAAGAAAMFTLGGVGGALASEFDLLAADTPTNGYIIDDASVLSRTSRKGLNDDLARLEKETGYRLEVATVRKLETESDAFAFGDKLIEKWYKTVDQGTDKGILLLVTSAKEGGLTGGPKFLKALGDPFIDSIVSENIPILAGDEKFNELTSSIVKRVEAVLKNKEDPGPPKKFEANLERTYKTKEETNKSRNITGTIVVVLLAISVVVPMLQYWGYTSKD